MFTPKYPPQDTAPAPTVYSPAPYVPAPYVPAPAPLPSTQASTRPTVQLTPSSVLALAAVGGALVLVVGAVLVSMLLAVAITAASVAVCAVTVRSILRSDSR
ncbi:SpdD protein [Streptomyces sp. NPDC001388]|uniref:SpdD protein n=1 Tax=Streptomyces sp. NPDC001388 TaxID=3364568 RepID=UPI0036AE1238